MKLLSNGDAILIVYWYKTGRELKGELLVRKRFLQAQGKEKRRCSGKTMIVPVHCHVSRSNCEVMLDDVVVDLHELL